MTFVKIENEPHRPAVISTASRLSYTEMWDRVDGFIEDILELNFGPGQYEVILVEDHEFSILHMLSGLASWGAAGMVGATWPALRLADAVQLLRGAGRKTRKSKTVHRASRAVLGPTLLPLVEKEDLPDARNRESGSGQRLDEAQPLDVLLAVPGLGGARRLARHQQTFAQVVLHRRERNAGTGDQLGNAHGPSFGSSTLDLGYPSTRY